MGSIALTLMGPSKLFGLPDTIYLMAAGTMLLGVSIQMLAMSTILFTREGLKLAFPTHDDSISKLIGSTRIIISGFAFTLAPFYGSTVQKFFGFGILCDSINIGFLCFLVVLVVSLVTKRVPAAPSELEEPLLA